jgi:hypothetical protein
MRHIRISLLFVLCLASTSFAQDLPRFEVYGAPAVLRDPHNLTRYGWVASFSTNVNKWLGLKNEVGGFYSDSDDVHSFLFGPQFTLRKEWRVEPWAHFLVGPQHHSQSFPSPFPTGTLGFAPTITVSSTNIAIQPGGGIDFSLNSRMGLRFGFDYVRAIRDPELDFGNYRAHAGVVFKLR